MFGLRDCVMHPSVIQSNAQTMIILQSILQFNIASDTDFLTRRLAIKPIGMSCQHITDELLLTKMQLIVQPHNEFSSDLGTDGTSDFATFDATSG